MENLKTLRKQAGVTMKALGSELGMAESTISLYESGKRCPDIQTLIRFADYFNVSLDNLCGREYNTENENRISERRLISLYRQLNIEGQEKMIDYADDLVQSSKYIKIDANFVGKEA